MRSNLCESAAHASAMAVVLESMQLNDRSAKSPRTSPMGRTSDLHGAVHLGEIAIRDHHRRLIADADLESGGAPIDKLNSPLGLEVCDGAVNILGDDVSPVQEAGGHVLALARIALHHLIVGFETRHGDLLHRIGLVGRLGRRNHGSVGDQGEVDAGIRNQIGLKLVQVDVKRAIKPKGRRDRGHHCTTDEGG